MNAKIDLVDYEALPGNARRMREYGKQLNTEMTKTYSNVREMHNDWYGDRYNDLVKAFNNLTTLVNDMLRLVVKDIPSSLETVANNYSMADRGTNATVVSDETPLPVENLPIVQDVGMRFLSSNVETRKNEINSYFENAKNIMANIETEYKTIQWQSEASEAFKVKFNKLKSDIITSFDSIKTQFTNSMEQTREDIERAEQANTVN